MKCSLKLISLFGLTAVFAFGSVAHSAAQTLEQPSPLLKVRGTLQRGDETLDDGRFYDVHEFTGQADQTVTLLLESGSFDPYLLLEDKQGNYIASNDDISFYNFNAAVVVTLPATGRYRILTRAYASDGRGSYRLTVQPTPDDSSNPLLTTAQITLLDAKQNLLAGSEHYERSEFQTALNLWEEALVGFRSEEVRINLPEDGRRGESNALANIGTVYTDLGYYGQALDFHQQSLAIKRDFDDREGEANSLGNIGNIYHLLGDYRQAIDFQHQSLDIVRQIGDREGEVNSLANIGLAHRFLGNNERAIGFHQQSLDLSRELNYSQGEAGSLINIGLVHQSLGDYEQAINFYQQSLDIAREIDSRSSEATSLGNIGLAYSGLRNYERSSDFQQQSLDIRRDINDRHGESISLHDLGMAFGALDKLSEAAQYFQLSAEVQESLHSPDIADPSRLSLLDSQQSTYFFWQQALMLQGKHQAALEASERGRAQALSTSMSRALTSATDEGWNLPSPPNLTGIQSIAIQQQSTLVEYSVLPNGRIFIWVVQPDGTIHATESNAAALDDSLGNTANLFADLGQNGRGGPAPETSLSTLVENTQSVLNTTRGDNTGTDNTSQLSRQQLDNNLQQLHALLIDPIEQWLPTDENERVIFIPHRELFRIPFAALQDSEDFSYLIERHTVLTAPSIKSLDVALQHRSRIQTANATDALIVGNPTLPDALKRSYGWEQLPGAEDEAGKVADALSQYLGTEVDALTQDDATETAVKQRLHTARFIHLATHGMLASGNADDPQSTENIPPNALQYSTIPGILALAAAREDNGIFTADELLKVTINNPLNAEIVVLSACQTGQGPITSDGVYGLSRTLLTAGVPTLVVSLWNASDTQTVGLMDEFYRQVLGEGQDKAQALRQAMLKMIGEGDDHPQYWAAFTLVGSAE